MQLRKVWEDTNEMKHIAVGDDTKDEFDRLKRRVELSRDRNVTQDELMAELVELHDDLENPEEL